MIESLRKFEIPESVTFESGDGGLPRARIVTPWSQAEVYLHGAHVTGFQKRGEPPFLFLSQRSYFTAGKAIRGGVPICFPWFGSRPGQPAHGFARITDWELKRTSRLEDGGIVVQLRLPEISARDGGPRFRTELVVTVTDRLTLELVVANEAAETNLEFEACLHTYLAVGDLGQTRITGLESAPYLDKLDQGALRLESQEPLRIVSQTDRMYLDHTNRVEVLDPVFDRQIRIDKSGSASTVVWNPWSTQPLTDFGPEEYRQMVCVESGNVERNRIRLRPGQTSRMEVTLSSS